MIEHCYCFRQKHLLQNYFIFFQVNDDWHVTDVKDATSMKPAQIFVQGDLTWDQLQMLISKSTTADLLKVLTHLFFYSKPALIFHWDIPKNEWKDLKIFLHEFTSFDNFACLEFLGFGVLCHNFWTN